MQLREKLQEYMDVAEKAASFIRRQLYNEQAHRLQHSFRNGPSKAPGFLDDYAFLISGLLDLFEFGGGIEWLLWAIEMQDTQARTGFQQSSFPGSSSHHFHSVGLTLVDWCPYCAATRAVDFLLVTLLLCASVLQLFFRRRGGE